MQKQEGVVVFDIGKTHKKCFLFSRKFQVLYQDHISIQEIPDEDGFLSEDLISIVKWMEEVLERLQQNFQLTALNFSAYGASLILIDSEGNPLLPLYNYLKPTDSKIENEFYNSYPDLELSSASPRSGFLNSGFQLVWLKKRYPQKFNRVQHVLHLPQFFHYWFTKQLVSEACSIGCHTSLWNYTTNSYQKWVSEQGFANLLPPIVRADITALGQKGAKNLPVGVGLHDSSAALIPYLKAEKEPFVLLSTGTWNVSLNPFSKNNLSQTELTQGCLTYRTIEGNSVKASRFFMGGAHDQLCKRIRSHFECATDFYKEIDYDPVLYDQTKAFSEHSWSLSATDFNLEASSLQKFDNPTTAYYAVMKSLIEIQVQSIQLVLDQQVIKLMYIDGGFQKNKLFVKRIGERFPKLKVYRSDFSLGAALGAALCVQNSTFSRKNLHNIYGIKPIN